MAAIGRTRALILATAIGSGSMPAADRAVAWLTSTDAALRNLLLIQLKQTTSQSAFVPDAAAAVGHLQ